VTFNLAQFIADLAALLGCSPLIIIIVAVRTGSVVSQFYFDLPNDPKHIEAQALATEFVTLLTSNSSSVSSDRHQANGGSSVANFKAQYPPLNVTMSVEALRPTISEPVTAVATPSHSEVGFTAADGGILAASIIAFALIVGVAVFFVRRHFNAQEAERRPAAV